MQKFFGSFFQKRTTSFFRSFLITRNRLRDLSVVLGLLGLALGTVLIGWFGFGKVAHAALSVGPWGFAAVCAWQVVLFAALGLCWFVLLPADGVWRLWKVIWGRMVRDAAGGLLPLSLVGGFVFGARVLTLEGVSWPAATASTVVDLSTEFLSQIGLVLMGVLILTARVPGWDATVPALLGLAVALAGGVAFIWFQSSAASPLPRVSRRLLGRWAGGAEAPMAAIQAALSGIYANPWRVGLSTGLHVLAWFGTGFASWIAFRLLGANIDYVTALGIEALLHAVLATAILVPAFAGVQEAAYAGVGALFGQPPEIALGVSLLRRARDITLGVPILLVWQWAELRHRRGWRA